MTLKTTIQAAAIVYTVTSRYYASYLSHTVEYINWILITCSVQIITVFSPEHNFANTTPVKILFGHVRLYTNFPLKRCWLCVHRSSVCVNVLSVPVWFVSCLWSSRILWTHYIIYMSEKLVFYIPYEEARTNSEEWHYSTTFVDILGLYV
jgi:hypothetical protein